MLKVVLLCLCLGVVACKNLACPQGFVNCFVAPCQFAHCDNHPNAVCHDDYCGGCNDIWFENGVRINDCTNGASS
ncbi:hypothetical protein V1264_006754 [Littorina saxatilis]|uniref:Uncharacterized protein n=1 Tax=Littorina saxatilis TaxID=31220 RepID=A0AAN9AYK7_9CAEN